MDYDGWDLNAVVRGCAAIASFTGAATSTSSCGQVFSSFQQDFSFKAMFEPKKESFVEDLHDLYKPFFPKSLQPSQMRISPQTLPLSSTSALGGLQDLQTQHQRLQTIKPLPLPTELLQKHQPLSDSDGSKAGVSQNPTLRSKRRKNHLKKVCHVSAENLSSDKWSWRKYGQKPIKGSPYPRGYYKCSTSKGCMARKQVERNRSDPAMFIVTYTAEHNHPMPTHRNSLAGSTRQKLAGTPSSDEYSKPSYSPGISSAASHSPPLEKLDGSREDLPEVEEEDDGFCVTNMTLDEDLFAGLEDFTRPDAGECMPGCFPAHVQFPWVSNSAATTAGGG